MQKIKNKKKALALIHIAKKQLALEDDIYRQLLNSAAGITSAKDIEYQWQYQAIIETLKRAGFTPKPYHEKWGCSLAQKALIENLWKEVARHKTKKSLYKFIETVAGVSHPRWLTEETTKKVILALKRTKKYAKKE